MVNGGKKGEACPGCGKSDPGNVRFCVYCGATITKATEQKETASLSEPQSAQEPVSFYQTTSAQPRNTGKLNSEKLPAGNFLIAEAAGVVVGAILISIGHFSSATDGLQEGLVVYGEPYAQVSVSDQPGSSFTIGHTGETGTLRLSALPAGAYDVNVVAPGGKSWREMVELSNHQEKKIGIPWCLSRWNPFR